MNQENQFSAQQQKLEKSDSEKRNVIPTIHSQNQQFCKICGAPLDEGDLFCIQCGRKIDFSDEEKNSNQDEQKSEIKISSDWLNAAKRQQKIGLEEKLKNHRKEFEKFKSKNDETKSLSVLSKYQSSDAKYFVYKDEKKTEYLIIKSVSGSKISGEIRTVFNNSGFANERFEGTIQGDSLSFHIVQKDFHPLPGEKIIADISFSGIIENDKIAGTIELENGPAFISYVKC